MKRISKYLALACGLALLAALPVAGEDLTILSTTTAGGKTGATTQYLSSSKVRTGDGQNDTIVEYASGRMVMINHKKKEYSETSLAEMSAAFQQLEAQIQGNPIMEKLMGKVGEVKVQKGSASKKIAGYDCDQYTLTMDESMSFDVWAARGLEPPAQYYDAAKAPWAAAGPVGRKFERMYNEMRKVKGFPLATTMSYKMLGKKMDVTSEATEVKKGSIPDSAFVVPAGYKKKDAAFKQK